MLTWQMQFLGKPGPPLEPIEFTKVSSTMMSFFWNPLQDDGGCRIKHYAVQKRETDRDTWHRVDEVKDVSVIATELKAGKEYVYRIRYV